MAIPFLSCVAASASLLPVGAGISRYRRLSPAMKVFLLLCLLTSIEIAGEFASSLKHLNNLYLINNSLPVETTFIAVVYALAVVGRKIRGAIIALAAVFICVWIPDKILFEVPGHLNEEMALVSRIFIMALSIIALHLVAKRTTNALTDEPMFWVTSANILYSTGVIFLFGLGNELLEMGVSYFLAAWKLNWSLQIVANIMFAKGFLCKVTPQI